MYYTRHVYRTLKDILILNYKKYNKKMMRIFYVNTGSNQCR